MTRSAATLATGFATLVPTANVNVAKTRIANAFVAYFSEAVVAGSQANSVALGGAPKTAMVAAMTELNTSGGAAAAIAAGIVAFWGGLSGIEASVWDDVPLWLRLIPGSIVPPDGNVDLVEALEGAFATCQATKPSLEDASIIIADAIHGTQAGGTVQGMPMSDIIVDPITYVIDMLTDS